MSDTLDMRTAIIGLIGFAALEEEMLLAEVARSAPEPGSPERWAAWPLIAHNTDFKCQQVQRLEAIREGEVPPAFAEIDHSSAETYLHYSEQGGNAIREASRRATQALVDGVNTTSDEDLLDPSRHPWLAGRKLWLQIVVRGFWHPTGHLGDYYLARGQPERAVALQAHAVAQGVYVRAPGEARGMAYYNLACAQARTERPDDAFEALRTAIGLNADLRANVTRDRDLEGLRVGGRLEALLGSP
jgi:tetratricopeptide (TPR) repeat protein